jgi:hypothetical protein
MTFLALQMETAVQHSNFTKTDGTIKTNPSPIRAKETKTRSITDTDSILVRYHTLVSFTGLFTLEMVYNTKKSKKQKKIVHSGHPMYTGYPSSNFGSFAFPPPFLTIGAIAQEGKWGGCCCFNVKVTWTL